MTVRGFLSRVAASSSVKAKAITDLARIICRSPAAGCLQGLAITGGSRATRPSLVHHRPWLRPACLPMRRLWPCAQVIIGG